MKQNVYEALDAALTKLIEEAAVPARFSPSTKALIEDFEDLLIEMFAEEDKQQAETVSHGVTAQKRILSCERESLLKQISEMKGWFGAATPNDPSSPVVVAADALARGLRRYLEDETEFEMERELSEAPAQD